LLSFSISRFLILHGLKEIGTFIDVAIKEAIQKLILLSLNIKLSIKTKVKK
jgi:hypothetical protein